MLPKQTIYLLHVKEIFVNAIYFNFGISNLPYYVMTVYIFRGSCDFKQCLCA